MKAGAAQAERVVLMWALIVDLSFFPYKGKSRKAWLSA